MKKKYLWILLSLLMLIILSCEDKDELSINLDKDSITLDIYGNEQSITVTTNGKWRLSSPPEWLFLDPASGENRTKITIRAIENEELEQREASIVFSCKDESKTLIVKQLGLADLDPYLKLNKNRMSVGVEANEEIVELTTNRSWTATDIPDWVTVNPSSGDRKARITISVNENKNTQGRTAQIKFTNKDGSIKEIVNISQFGRKDYIELPQLPIFHFNEVSYKGELNHYDVKTYRLFINSKIKNNIYLGNLICQNAQSNINIPVFTGYTFNPITISTSAPVSGNVVKTYVPSWAEQDAFAKEIIAEKPTQNESFVSDNGNVEFYSYKQLYAIGMLNLGEPLDQVVSGASYLDKEMSNDNYGFIFSFKQSAFSLIMDFPNQLVKEKIKDADIAKGMSYVIWESYGRIGLLIVESNSIETKTAINNVLWNKKLTDDETKLIQSAKVAYVYYNNNKQLQTYKGSMDAVLEYKKAILNKSMDNIYPLEFEVATIDNGMTPISFSVDMPNK